MKYVLPHKKISRAVTQEDTDRMISDAIAMQEMCSNPPKYHSKAFAVAHSQFDDKDPLRFFVTREGEIIINPVILSHDHRPVIRKEACTTFGISIPPTDVARVRKLVVEYFVIEDEVMKTWIKKKHTVNGQKAQIFQHEIDHMNAKYIYDMSKYPFEIL